MVFTVVMCWCESWTIKKAEHRKESWCFRTVVLKKMPENSLDSKAIKPVNPKGNQSWLFIGRTDAEAEVQSFGHLMERADSRKRLWCWERLKAGGEGGDRGWDGWMASVTQWTWVGANSGKMVKIREAWHAAVHWITKGWTRLNNWTTRTCKLA